MGQALKKYAAHYTVNDWELWQDRWELIDGIPYCMSPAPSIQHQFVNSRLIQVLNNSLTGCGKCIASIFIDWQINEDTVVQPDVPVICKGVMGNKLLVPPSIIFEILSPSTKAKDKTVKFSLYESQKVKYYVLVDLEKKSLEFNKLQNRVYKKQKAGSSFLFELDECSFEFNFSEIWG